MKKLRFLPLFLLLLLILCTTAQAAGIPGQQSILGITDANGDVTALTDGESATAWTKSANAGVDLTISLYRATVGEIWIRNGYAYTQNWYNNYDRPGSVKVTVYYGANQYVTSYDTYRYTLSDAYRPNTQSANWNSGYQRLLLPRQYTNVSRIELTVESVINGYSRTGATISDIIVASGSHATATPKAYATATPKPYVVYVTPTPGTGEEDPTSAPTRTPIVTVITPPADPNTPVPERTPIVYPSAGGVRATLSQRIATRSGPGTRFDEPGSFFASGDEVKVLTKVYDNYNNIIWFQIEFQYKNEWYRAYTTETRVNIDPSLVPSEPDIYDPLDTRTALKKTYVYFGPGTHYKKFTASVIHPGNRCDIYAIENGWAQIEYTDYGSPEDPQPQRRGWVPVDVLYASD